MPGEVFLLPFRPGLDANAIPIVGARLEFYRTGTSTPQAVFADEELTVPLGAVVQANSAGKWPTIYLDKAKIYRAVMRSPDGETLAEADPYVAGVVDNLAPEIALNAALSTQQAAIAGAFATALMIYSQGYIGTDATPPAGIVDGEGYIFAVAGRVFGAIKAGNTGEVKFEILTAATISTLGFISSRTKADAFTAPTDGNGSIIVDGDVFDWRAGDMSAWVARDPSRSVFIPPSNTPSGSNGAYARRGPWELGTVYATWFGYKADSNGVAGNGTDNAAALQAAIDFVCPFVWKGGTRATELQGSFSGEVILPKGIGRIGSKIKLAPNLTLRGQGAANDWTVRTGVAGAAQGNERMGTALFCDIADYSTYALDTCPYDASGVRLEDTTVAGGDSSQALKTQVANFRMFSMTLYGNWTCKALNLAGAESCYVADDVIIRGFTVGVRASATWYGKFRARVLHNWRGCIAYLSATDLDLSASSWWVPVEAPKYDPAVNGYDGTEPTIGSWWTAARLAKTAHIFNFYSNLYASNIACELGDYMFMSKSGVNDFSGIYTEGAQEAIIITEGPDQQNEVYSFDTIVTANVPLIFAKDARLQVTVAHHNGQNGYSQVIGDLVNTIGYEGVPRLNGVRLKPADVFSDQSVAYSNIAQLQGAWTPVPKFGGANADSGTGTKVGRWVRIGNMVTATAYINLQTVSGSGAFTIDGLPFRVRDFFGMDAPVQVAFGFGAPAIARGRGIAGSYIMTFDGVTHAGFVNGADLRVQMTYETDENGPWGW